LLSMYLLFFHNNTPHTEIYTLSLHDALPIYQGNDKQHITEVLNAILAAYSQQNIERRSAETAQTLKFLEDQLPELKQQLDVAERDRKSTRLNSSHVKISYAVFCLKKKKTDKE